jgi:hypothetical protein
MERHVLYVNHSEESESEIENSELKKQIAYSDKETLLKIIRALMDSNAALRKYIEIIEKKNH